MFSSEFISNARPYLEAAYFMSGVLLLIGLLITYLQVSLIKRDFQLRNARAAKENAIKACVQYYSKFVPDYDTFCKERDAQGLARYSGPIGDFTPQSLSNTNVSHALKKLTLKKLPYALNDLEGVAALFVTGVADERTGFQIIGRTFCRSVEACYDIIAACRSEKAQPYWYNIVRLYLTWRPRLERAEVASAIQDLLSKSGMAGPEETINPLSL